MNEQSDKCRKPRPPQLETGVLHDVGLPLSLPKSGKQTSVSYRPVTWNVKGRSTGLQFISLIFTVNVLLPVAGGVMLMNAHEGSFNVAVAASHTMLYAPPVGVLMFTVML